MERKQKNKYLYLIFAILVILFIIPVAIRRMNDAVVENIRLAGEETAHVYALNEVITSGRYESLVRLLEYQLRPENRTDDCSDLIGRSLEFAVETMELGEIDAYASIDGKICAAQYWEGDEGFDPSVTEWYQKAIEADGRIIYTDAYTDVYSGKTVVTLAMMIEGTQDVVAVDIYPFNEMGNVRTGDILEGTNYYLCDSKGMLLAYSVSGQDQSNLQERFDRMFEEIMQESEEISYTISGIDGVKKGVYHYQLDSGWYAIVTIPYDTLTEPYDDAWGIFLAVIVVFILMAAVFAVIDFRTNRKAKVYNEIIGVLGNSYYALYQINLTTEQYFMMKGSDYVRSRIPRRGKYSQLLAVLKELVGKSDYAEFVKTFSTDNIKELVRNRVRDFGGDFKRRFNGEYRWVHVQMLYDESLQRGTVVLAFKDINEGKEQDLSRLELLKKSLESVDKMAKSKNMFFSQMSHDMRTPLNGIIGLTRIAERQTDDPRKMKETLKKISRLGNQLLELINEILDISRIEQGKIELRSESFSLKEKLEELIEIYTPQMQEKDRVFRTEVHIKDTYIIGDWGKIQQILNNILSNAMKYTEKGGMIELTVTENIDSNSKYRKYCFRVRDDGAGMSREFLEKLFVPFERETQFGAAKVSGTGLGLPIVHELVQKMEGTIEVESELGKGSVFEVVIPCRISEEEQEKKEKAGKEHTEGREKEQPETGQQGEKQAVLEGKRVLLAEDNEINIEIAAELLKTFGMEVVPAWNGKEALELFKGCDAGYFDLILMDMQMPVMDGCTAAEMIRRSKKEDAESIPIIAVTANAFAEDIALTTKAGMNAHISKPIDLSILKDTMEKLLGGHLK